MPVVLRHNATLELNLAEYAGAVTPCELKALAMFLSRNDRYLPNDTLNVVMPDANFSAVPLPMLDELYERYREFYLPLKFQIFRNSAWICLSASARRHIHYWIGERDARESMSSTVRQFESVIDAAEWLMLSAREFEMVERGEGFVDIAQIEKPDLRMSAAAG